MKKNDVYTTKFFEVTILTCQSPDYWYDDIVGEKIKVREVNWSSAFVEASTGESCLRDDLRITEDDYKRASKKMKEYLKRYLPRVRYRELKDTKMLWKGDVIYINKQPRLII